MLKKPSESLVSLRILVSSRMELAWSAAKLGLSWAMLGKVSKIIVSIIIIVCFDETALSSAMLFGLWCTFTQYFCTCVSRQWKRGRILKRSVWQIDINDVIFDRKISTDSKFSDDSGVSVRPLDIHKVLSWLFELFILIAASWLFRSWLFASHLEYSSKRKFRKHKSSCFAVLLSSLYLRNWFITKNNDIFNYWSVRYL